MEATKTDFSVQLNTNKPELWAHSATWLTCLHTDTHVDACKHKYKGFLPIFHDVNQEHTGCGFQSPVMKLAAPVGYWRHISLSPEHLNNMHMSALWTWYEFHKQKPTLSERSQFKVNHLELETLPFSLKVNERK